MPWTKIEENLQLQDGQHQGVEVNGEKLLICQVEGQVYATSNYCPHVGAILSPGDLEQGQIRCPLHNWTFDVKTGDCTFPQNGPALKTIPVRQVSGHYEVEL